jgi:hypothetical protein
MRKPWLPVFDWTDVNRRFKWTRSFRRKRISISARVPSHFNWPLLIKVGLNYRGDVEVRAEYDEIFRLQLNASRTTILQPQTNIWTLCYCKYGIRMLTWPNVLQPYKGAFNLFCNPSWLLKFLFKASQYFLWVYASGRRVCERHVLKVNGKEDQRHEKRYDERKRVIWKANITTHQEVIINCSHN